MPEPREGFPFDTSHGTPVRIVRPDLWIGQRRPTDGRTGATGTVRSVRESRQQTTAVRTSPATPGPRARGTLVMAVGREPIRRQSSFGAGSDGVIDQSEVSGRCHVTPRCQRARTDGSTKIDVR